MKNKKTQEDRENSLVVETHLVLPIKKNIYISLINKYRFYTCIKYQCHFSTAQNTYLYNVTVDSCVVLLLRERIFFFIFCSHAFKKALNYTQKKYKITQLFFCCTKPHKDMHSPRTTTKMQY